MAASPASPARPPAGEPLEALYLYTHDVARQLKPSADGELAHALHETLHFALDAQEQDWGLDDGGAQRADCGGGGGTTTGGALSTAAAAASSSSSSRVDALKSAAAVVSPRLADSQPSSKAASPSSRPVTLPGPVPELPPDVPPARVGFFPNPFWISPSSSSSSRNPSPPASGATSPARSTSARPRRTPPYISYGWQARSRTLSLPHPATMSNPTKLDPCSPENRSAFDVTAKLFFLDDVLSTSADRSAPEERDARAREAAIEAQAGKLATYVDNAIRKLSSSTGIITLDTLLLSFPRNNFEAPWGQNGSGVNGVLSNGSDEERMERLRVVAELWRILSQNPQLLSLGLSRFSLGSLQALFHLLGRDMPHPPGGPPPTTPALAPALNRSLSQAGAAVGSGSTQVDANAAARWPDAYSTPREVRRPRLVTAVLNSANGASSAAVAAASSSSSSNTTPSGSDADANGDATTRGRTGDSSAPAKSGAIDIPSAGSSGVRSGSSSAAGGSSRSVDESKALREWCEQEGIVPVADTDRKDILPRRTLPTLLREFRDALPHPVPAGHRLVPRWVMKYSVLIRDRGIIADRGYILYAEVEPEVASE